MDLLFFLVTLVTYFIYVPTSPLIQMWIKTHRKQKSCYFCSLLNYFFFVFKVEENVCYKSLGHSYFLEDGIEMYNTFDGNIAIGTLPGSLIPTDK